MGRIFALTVPSLFDPVFQQQATHTVCTDSACATIYCMSKTIVVDTSVLISALISSKGLSRKLLRLCLESVHKPLISNALFNEYEAVSRRASILDACPLSTAEIRTLLEAFYSTCQWVPVYYLWRPNVPDEGDNFLIELALAGNASHIITNNIKDLSKTELNFPCLQIVTPATFLEK